MVRIGMNLRPMRPDDIPAVVELEAATYDSAWSAAIFGDEIGLDNRVYLVAEDENGLAGYGGMMFVVDEAHVTTLAVAPNRRGAKVGTRIMADLVDEAIRRGSVHLTLEVRVTNVVAQDLYRRFGMAPVGVRKDYYQTEDALIMWAHEIDGPEYAERMRSIREELNA